MPQFIPGLELSRRFYWEAVRPILDEHFPELLYAAARIGTGSDVLGFDTEMSTDHYWGPMVQLFLPEEQMDLAPTISETLSWNLPHLVAGYPVNFEPVPDEPGVYIMRETGEYPINHRVTFSTVEVFFQQHLAYDIAQPPDVADWLTLSSQKLLETIAGAVHYDNVGDLTKLRERFAYYPHDIWLYLLASGWQRIGQEEHLMPRAGFVGDELGSALIGSRLVRDVMSLGFLIEKQYAPYPKWFGTAFQRLRCADVLTPSLWRAQRAETWQAREAALNEAYETLARAHNALGITAPVPETVAPFHGRPFNVIEGSRIADAIRAQITDPAVQRIAAHHLIGSLDQWSDSTDLRSNLSWRHALRHLYNSRRPTTDDGRTTDRWPHAGEK